MLASRIGCASPKMVCAVDLDDEPELGVPVTSQVWPKRRVEDAHIASLVSPQIGGLCLVGSF